MSAFSSKEPCPVRKALKERLNEAFGPFQDEDDADRFLAEHPELADFNDVYGKKSKAIAQDFGEARKQLEELGFSREQAREISIRMGEARTSAAKDFQKYYKGRPDAENHPNWHCGDCETASNKLVDEMGDFEARPHSGRSGGHHWVSMPNPKGGEDVFLDLTASQYKSGFIFKSPERRMVFFQAQHEKFLAGI
ncbi:MAG: hypothetical protein KKB20_17990 [Proteobacteria bacterium]|nr:hypothetical protein [Pseudomonadota bacterium]